MAKIFYAEDDDNLSMVVKETLESAGHEVCLFNRGDTAMQSFKSSEPDICILDVMLPQVDGFTLAKTIRMVNPQIPIIFISAKVQLQDKLEGLHLGGDDYIFKPFSIEELLLKIKIFVQRKNMIQPTTTPKTSKISLGKFIFYPENQTLSANGTTTNLTMRESELLQFLIQHSNQLLRREEILMALWGQDDYFLGRSLDVFISRLRKHLASDPAVKIETVPRVGFRLIC